MSTIDTKLTKHMEFFSFVCWTVVGISHTHSHTAHSVIIFLMVPLFSVVRSFLIIRGIKRKSRTRTQTHMMWAAEAPKQPICQQSKWRRGKKTIWRNSLNTHAHTRTRTLVHVLLVISLKSAALATNLGKWSGSNMTWHSATRNAKMDLNLQQKQQQQIRWWARARSCIFSKSFPVIRGYSITITAYLCVSLTNTNTRTHTPR